MRVCPNCGCEVTPAATICSGCGADLPRTRPLRSCLISGLSLVAIIAAAALLQSLLRERGARPTTDFVPASASVAIGLDARPEGSSLARWSAEDRRILAGRAVELAQQVVDRSGLQLDLEEKASLWFAGEVLVASVGHPHARPLMPRSFVLIARVTDMRRARGDMDQAVAELAREASWERDLVRSEGRTIVVWREPGRRSEIAYVATEGCLILSASSELLDLCLEAADDPGQRLLEAEDSLEIFQPLPDDRFLWCYANPSDVLPMVRSLVPALSEGWVGFIRSYFGRRSRPAGEGSVPGRVAVALTAEADGLRAHVNYWRAPSAEVPSPTSDSGALPRFIPHDAAAFVFVRGLPDLASLLLPERGPDGPLHGRAPSGGLLQRLLTGEKLPEAALLTLLGRKTGRPVLAGAFTGASAAQAAGRLAALFPDGKVMEANGTALFAADAEALAQLEEAARNPESRLDLPIGPDVTLYLWGRPDVVWPRLEGMAEIRLSVRGDASGGKAELHLRGEPRRFLGRP